MLDNKRYLNGKEYRYGYTTGTCAASAAKAAVIALLENKQPNTVEIKTPSSQTIEINVFDYKIIENAYQCYVIKDAGDDPDVTHGIKVYAKAYRNTLNKIEIKGGLGIGTVTKKGLQVAVGQPAINPVPMEMIRGAIAEIQTNNEGITVEISIPEGVEIAKQTFNERLGIIGGISILGTSGLVKPMSEEAFKESLSLEISVLKEKGFKEIMLTPGNYGERYIKQYLPQHSEQVVTTSNFIGYMLHESVRFGMKKVNLIGHIGKLIKVAGGIFHTHSSVADARNEIFASHYFMYSNDAEGFRKIMNSNTTEEAVEYVKDRDFFNLLAQTIKCKCEQHVKGALEVEVLLISMNEGLLGSTKNINTVI